MAATRTTPLTFDDLDGWARDDHAAALAAYATTAPDGARLADDWPTARAYFESCFRPVLIEDGAPMLFTGYYEPVLPASRRRTPRFATPIYAPPPELPPDAPWLTRAEIENGALEGRGLELAWLACAVDAFFLQVQGSGRLELLDGGTMRVNFAARNKRPYTSIGRALIDLGHIAADAISAQSVKDWLRAHPGPARDLMQRNESFVFFRESRNLSDDCGPIGAMDMPVVPLRSIAVDPAHVRLGLPVWIETDTTPPLRRLMIAQDTGGAIIGAQRADIYLGTGEAAGLAAGRINHGGRMVVLLPQAEV